MNTFGTLFRLTTFGESHGPAVGGVVDGMPAGIEVDVNRLQAELHLRRGAYSALATQRHEADRLKILSGIFEGKTTGTPIAFIVENSDTCPADYEQLRTVYRPSHADYTYEQKYRYRDHRGGGRASARSMVSRIVAGGLATQLLHTVGVSISARVEQVGEERNPAPERIKSYLQAVRDTGDTVGGVVSCVLRGVPAGWGEPEFGKLHAQLGFAMLSIPAAKGFDYGDGFASASHRGSAHNDEMTTGGTFLSNHDGGIQGGISNGQDIFFRVAFKPIPSIAIPQRTSTSTGQEQMLTIHGRHDVCAAVRAVPIVEASAAIVLADAFLQHRARTLKEV